MAKILFLPPRFIKNTVLLLKPYNFYTLYLISFQVMTKTVFTKSYPGTKLRGWPHSQMSNLAENFYIWVYAPRQHKIFRCPDLHWIWEYAFNWLFHFKILLIELASITHWPVIGRTSPWKPFPILDGLFMLHCVMGKRCMPTSTRTFTDDVICTCTWDLWNSYFVSLQKFW